MGAGKRIVSFGAGGTLGFLVGAAVAQMAATESGEQLRARIKRRYDEIIAAGAVAQAEAEESLVRRYREETGSGSSFAAELAEATRAKQDALAALAADSLSVPPPSAKSEQN